MPVLSKAEDGVRMQPEEYFTYFEDCILSPDNGECEAFPLNKGIGQTRAFIDSLPAGGNRAGGGNGYFGFDLWQLFI